MAEQSRAEQSRAVIFLSIIIQLKTRQGKL